MGIEFGKAAAFPTATRNKAANEYAGLVKEMIDTGEARSAVLSCKNEEERKAVDNLVYAVQSAGRDAGVSIRKHVAVEKGKATVTFIARDKITRTRTTAQPA
jgi:hypothetical protein